jgi:hypothetical protein
MAQNQLNSEPKDYVDEQRSRYDIKYTNTDQTRGYSIGTYEYPAGLRTKQDLQHYIAFYINVRDKTSAAKKLREEGRLFDQSPEEKRRVSNLTPEAKQAGADSIVDNIGIITGVSTFLATPKKGIASTIGAAIGGGAVGLGTAALAQTAKKLDTNAFDWNTTSRLKDVITLHIEDKPTVKYGANYTEKDLGTLAGLLMQGSVAQSIKDVAGEGTARLIAQAIKLPGSIFGLDLNNVREAATATRTNPFKEVFFESVDYRTFSFRYKFFPKDLSESNKVHSIIKMFKQHMHPELSAQKMFYVYPSEFSLRYFYKDKENDWLHKFATCVLTDMSVEYGGDQFSTFENGAPVEIGMSLTFREIEQITTDGINYGY